MPSVNRDSSIIASAFLTTRRHNLLWYLLFALLLTHSTGCKKIMLWSYGIKSPSLESEQSLKDYLSKLGLESENLYVLRDTNDLNTLINKVQSFPDAFFFNAQKQYVPYRAKPSDCNAGVVDFTKDMTNLGSKAIDTSYQFSFFQDKMRSLPGLQPVDSIAMSGKDAYVFLMWATYYGKLNETKVLNWVKHIHEAQQAGVNVGYYLISCDYIKDWGIKQEDIPVLELAE